MSVAEFGPRSQTAFMSTLPRMRSEPRAGRYEMSWHSLQSELDPKSARLRLLPWQNHTARQPERLLLTNPYRPLMHPVSAVS